MVRVHVIDSPSEFHDACESLRRGNDGIAIDAERASGFTYSQRAFLIQVYRRGAGTFLFDPPAIGDMSTLTDVGGDEEWIIHAASQDLACLREVGIEPRRLFDTELAARLLGFEKVGLGSIVDELLGVHLAKEHSAVDWSTRPLPEPWLEYAALDVELLVDLRERLSELLRESHKSDFAAEEFAATLRRPMKEASPDPWRRLSGLHTVRTPRAMAMARELWIERDAIAANTDTAPGRLVPDSSIIAAVLANPATKSELASLKAFHGRASRTYLDNWWSALQRGAATDNLPPVRVASSDLPPPRAWPDRNPEAHNRLVAAREAIAQIAQEHTIPVENLISPGLIRQLAWTPPDPLTLETVVKALTHGGARSWQVRLIGGPVVESLIRASQDGERTSRVVAHSPRLKD